jgi:(4S)-4-hydroxy-5-phosphonooxypentane-2,3-dione isomerase
MTAFAIVVEFRLKPGTRAEFRRLIDRNAKSSVGTEPGCRQFDVLEPKEKPDSIFLYEIYDDEAAFAAHLQSEHYAVFNSESAPFITERSVIKCDLVCEGSAGTAS